MTTSQYLIAWAVYLVGAAGCTAVWWKMTSILPESLFQRWVRLVAGVILFTPGFSYPDMGFLAPAFLVTLFDGLTYGPDAMIRNGQVILIVLAVTTLLLLIFGRNKVKNSKPAKRTNKKSQTRREPVTGSH